MKLLRPRAEPGGGAGSVAVFGVGLVGGAIAGSLAERDLAEALSLDLAWSDPAALDRGLAAVERELAGDARIDLVWSAGGCGFGATESETAGELSAFRAVLGLAARLAEPGRGQTVRFHLISSAGGLYEGQRFVTAASRPRPRRPYGVLKLRQEELLERAGPALARATYRLTSVYGPVRPGRRMGLIPTLIANGLEGRVSRITGTMNTLRDYVWVGDVARFVAQAILDRSPAGRPPAVVLAAGKPSSLFEIQTLVERVLGRRLYVHYTPEPTNFEDITFAAGLRPEGWCASELRSNIRAIYESARG